MPLLFPHIFYPSFSCNVVDQSMTVLMISMNSLFKKVRVMMVMVTKGICKIWINPISPMPRVRPPNEIWVQLLPNVFVSASRDSNLSFLIVKVPKIWKLTPKWPLYWVRPPTTRQLVTHNLIGYLPNSVLCFCFPNIIRCLPNPFFTPDFVLWGRPRQVSSS